MRCGVGASEGRYSITSPAKQDMSPALRLLKYQPVSKGIPVHNMANKGICHRRSVDFSLKKFLSSCLKKTSMGCIDGSLENLSFWIENQLKVMCGIES